MCWLVSSENQYNSSKLISKREDLENNIKLILNDGSHKRPEENYKFVFKRCLDYMKEAFRKSHPEINKKNMERKFYEHYFLDISKETGIPLEHFFDPKNGACDEANVPKTINGTYIKNISKSDEFKKEFTAFMTGELRTENLNSLTGKIDALITKWEKQIADAKSLPDVIESIRKDIEKNKKAKLPWTIKEIDEAIKSVQWLFDSNGEKGRVHWVSLNCILRKKK